MWDLTRPWTQRGSFISQATPPESAPTDDPLVCVQFNEAWQPLAVGALMQLIQPSSWTGDQATKDAAVQAATELIALFGDAEECPVISFRFVSCTLQYSLDGGSTWTDTPGWDTFSPDCFTGPPGPEGPAGPSVPAVPPNPQGSSTSDLACNIAGYLATNVIQAAIQQQVDAINATATLVDAALGLVSLIPGLDLVTSIGLAVAYALNTEIASAGVSTYETALADTTLWSEVMCAIYTHIVSVGYVDATNYAAVGTALAAILYADPGVVTSIVNYWTNMTLTGVQATQSAGSLYEGDCSACGTWCYEWDFTVSNQGWSHVSGQGVYTAGVGWQSQNSGGTQKVYIYLPISSTHITGMAIQYTCTTTTSPDGPTFLWINGAGTQTYTTGVTAAQSSPHNIAHPIIPDTITEIDARINLSGGSGTATIIRMQLSGNGTNPFGSDNCSF